MAQHQENIDPIPDQEMDSFDDFVQYLRENMEASQAQTVLVVEDSRMMRDLICKFISQAAPLVKIVRAENGKDALGKLAWIRETTQQDPMLIITDLEMPVMDGWQLIKVLQKNYEAQGHDHGIPLIVLSSTEGEKGFLFKRSIRQCEYQPMAAVAKASCMNPRHYDAIGNKGLLSWIEYFLHAD